jgi:hypothetical protein
MYQCASAQSTALIATCLKVLVGGAAKSPTEGPIEDAARAESRHRSRLTEELSNRLVAGPLRKTPFSLALTENSLHEINRPQPR